MVVLKRFSCVNLQMGDRNLMKLALRHELPASADLKPDDLVFTERVKFGYDFRGKYELLVLYMCRAQALIVKQRWLRSVDGDH